jgi:glycerol-3-phosphate acyltransferase PlsY
MFTLAVVLVGSYLLGSVPFGYLAGKIRGIDIRTIGSGNVGATNVVRVLGKAYGYPVFVLDFLKGLGAVKISMWVAMLVHPDRGSPEVFGIVAAGGSVIGHCFPLWLKFKGGKGVATSAGALFALMPLAFAIGVAIWLVIFWFTRYVSLASMTAAVALPFVILILSSLPHSYGTALFYFSVCLAAVVIWQHRENLNRLLRGSEPRFTRK